MFPHSCIVSLTLRRWFKFNFWKVKFSVWFSIIKWFSKRTLKTLPFLWAVEHVSTKHVYHLLLPCSRRPVPLITNRRICSNAPLSSSEEGMAGVHSHHSSSRQPFTLLICSVSFTLWLNCFSGKQESMALVPVISRILREKTQIT